MPVPTFQALSYFEKLYFLTWTKTKALTFRGRRFVPVRPSSQLGGFTRSSRWIESLERRDGAIRVTTLERTLADVLARPDLAGGLEEAWRSCSAIPGLDLRELESYVRALRSRVVAAKVGFYLERRREMLAVPDALLDRLEDVGPATPVYMERTRSGRILRRWKLVAPNELLAGDWEAARVKPRRELAEQSTGTYV